MIQGRRHHGEDKEKNMNKLIQEILQEASDT